MNNYPEYVEIKGKKYKINSDFKIAIECNKVAQDKSIGDTERALAIIYLLYGYEGLKAQNDYEKLLKLGKKFLLCGKEEVENPHEKPDMDYEEDMDYIEVSFLSDYGIVLDKMHWWKFNKLINGLSNSEFGNCCILNRIRNLRNYNTKEIKDPKERQKIEEAKKEVELKCNKKKITEKERESATKIFEQIRIGKE